MVNPYERLSAFKARRTRRMVVSAKDLPGRTVITFLEEPTKQTKPEGTKPKETRKQDGKKNATDIGEESSKDVSHPVSLSMVTDTQDVGRPSPNPSPTQKEDHDGNTSCDWEATIPQCPTI